MFHPETPGAQFQPDGDRAVASAAGRPTTAATARSPRSATRTATAGCCRRSRRGCPAGSTPQRRRSPRRPTWRRRCGAPRPRTASTRRGPAQADANWPDWYAEYMVAEQAGEELPDVSDYDVIVDRRRLARRALRRRAGRGRPARRRRRARAGRRRVLVLGVHPVEDAAASGRGGARRTRRGRDRARSTSRRRSPGATSWSRTTPTPGRSAGSPSHGIDLLRGTRPARRDRAWSRSTACATPPSTSSWRPAPTRSCRRSPACASSTASGRTAR